MPIEDSVPRAREAQEELHGSVERLNRFTDLLRQSRENFPEINTVRDDYDRFARGVGTYMEEESASIDDTFEQLVREFSYRESQRNFMSPVFNFGQMDEVPSGGFMSPTYNFGGGDFSRGSSLPDSWDAYDWSGWEQVGEPVVDSPRDLFDDTEHRGTEGYSGWNSPVIYNPQIVSGQGISGGSWDGYDTGAPEDDDSGDLFDGMDMPWGNQAS